MGLARAVTQHIISTPSAPQFPNSATISEAVLIGTTPVLIAINRPLQNRRGFAIENDGSVPMIFGYGTAVSVATRTVILNPTDYFSDDWYYQGPVTAASTTAQTAIANVTELVII
jgi:hypothetical protein